MASQHVVQDVMQIRAVIEPLERIATALETIIERIDDSEAARRAEMAKIAEED